MLNPMPAAALEDLRQLAAEGDDIARFELFWRGLPAADRPAIAETIRDMLDNAA